MNKKVLILLSDTDPFLLNVYKHKFAKQAGWETVITNTPEELLKTVKKEQPDLIVTDVILKNGSAHEVIEEIKNPKNKKLSSIPIIILTDLKQDEDVKKFKELGANEYLIKSETSFNDVIKKVIDIKKSLWETYEI